MSRIRAISAFVVVASFVLASCSTLVTAYLLSQLLDEQAPKRTWSGTIRDTTGNPVGGIDIEVLGEIEGDTNVAKFKDTTDVDGSYTISFRWNKNVMYTVRVVHEGVIFASEEYGTIQLSDRVSDFVIQGAVNVELSGVVRGPDGDPLAGVVVVGASASALDATPVTLLNTDNKTAYDVTNDSGIYSLTGSISRYGVVCAFDPDHGFAYSYGEDDDSNGSIPLDITMGGKGNFDVKVQVVDGAGQPIVMQVLDADRQFRLRLGTPFNLGTTMDVAVAENGLFPGFVGEPSDVHPTTITLTIQATGLGGIAETTENVQGGNYDLMLLNVYDDEPATALVQSENPLVLHENSTVIVRVN